MTRRNKMTHGATDKQKRKCRTRAIVRAIEARPQPNYWAHPTFHGPSLCHGKGVLALNDEHQNGGGCVAASSTPAARATRHGLRHVKTGGPGHVKAYVHDKAAAPIKMLASTEQHGHLNKHSMCLA